MVGMKSIQKYAKTLFTLLTTNYLPNQGNVKQQQKKKKQIVPFLRQRLICRYTAETFPSPASLLWFMSRTSSTSLWESSGEGIRTVTAISS